MPYKSMEDVNPALKGIKPPITLSQANVIASWADSIIAGGQKNGWPIAIAQFKKKYKKTATGWVKATEGDPLDWDALCPYEDCQHKLYFPVYEAWYKCASCNGSIYVAESGNDFEDISCLKEDYAVEYFGKPPGMPREAKSLGPFWVQPIAEESQPDGDFLVSDGGEKHLPVKKNGKPSRRLMEAAWAVLRGNKYEGPKKAAALKKLRALYKREGIAVPEESIDYGATAAFTFAEVFALEKVSECDMRMEANISQFKNLAGNILRASPDRISDKGAAIRVLLSELSALVDEFYPLPLAEPEESLVESSEADVLAFTEELSEADTNYNPPQPGILALDIALIKPGWGNARDNHYYPKETLVKYANVFEGSKMYETDHRGAEKSTRTWVSTITRIAGFTDEGAPIGRVIVHDPNFAARCRNLNEAGLLQKMECSITAMALYKDYEENGRKGKLIKEITRGGDVDWVTKAGAGGHVLRISESDAEEGAVDEKEGKEVGEGEGELQEVVIHEAKTEEVQPVVEAAPQPAFLEKEAVVAILESSKLPKPVQEVLGQREYSDENTLKSSIEEMRGMVTKLLGSSGVFGVTTATKPVEKAVDIAEAERRVLKKYGLGGN